MLHKAQFALLLISCVSLTYILRDTNTSPGTLLRHSASRLLEDQQLTDLLCDGINQENDVTNDERQTAKDHQDFYAKTRDGNPLVKFIEGDKPAGQIKTEYAKPLAGFAVPFIIFLVITFCSCLYFVTVWCCVNIQWCSRFNVCKGPKRGGYRVVFVIATIVLMAGLVISGIVGIAEAASVKKGGNKVLCSVAVFAEKLLEGSPDEDWVGIEQTIKDFQIVLDDFYPMVARLTAAPSLVTTTTASGMVATVATAKLSVDTFYTLNFARSVRPRPDPLNVQQTYKPDYITGLSGVRDQIKSEMDNKKAIVDRAAVQADLGITQLRASSAVFFLVLQQAKNIAANVSATLSTAESNMTIIGDKARSGVGALGSSLIAVFSGNVVLGGLAIASTLLGLMGVRIFVKLIHWSWCGIMTLAIVGWTLAAVLYPGTLALFEGCDVGNRVLTNATFFNLTMDKFVVYNATDGTRTENGDMVKSLLYRCYYGDGDLIDELGLDPVFNMFTNMFEPLDNIAPLSTAVGPVPDSYIIPSEKNTVEALRLGMVPDSEAIVQDLSKLNNLVNTATNPCTSVQDFWVLNSATCPADRGTLFTSSSSAAFNLGSPTCIGYDAWANKRSSDRYTSSNFQPTACGMQGIYPTSTYLQNFVSNFATARSNSASLFGDIQSGLNTIASANQLYMNSVKLATSSFDPVRTATVNTRQAMWDPTTGFIPNANCTFFRKATETLVDSVCVRFGNSLFNVKAVTVAVSVFGMIGGIVVFLLAMKFFTKKNEETFNYLIEDHNPAV